MPQSSTRSPGAISFLDTDEFLNHDPSRGRLDKALEGNVTLSAVPDGAGGTRWEARTADGREVPLFQMNIQRPRPPEGGRLVSSNPVFVDALEGCFVCYEDEGAQRSWCMRVPCG